MKKEKESSGNLSIETKNYFGEVFSVLRVHNFCLSNAGMNLDRTRIGCVNSLSMNVIRLLVEDNSFLENFLVEDPENIHEYLWEKKRQPVAEKIEISQCHFTPRKKEILMKLGVMLEFGWEAVNEKGDNEIFSYADSSVRWGIEIVRSMLSPLIDKNKVKEEFEKIKNDPDKINRYYSELRFQVEDILYGKEQKQLFKELKYLRK
jgi:hypothetical protein